MNENLKPIEKLTPFTRMIMTIGTLPSSFYASMSYYESMVWLYEYLKNEVIPTVNNNAEAVEELQTAFTTLQNWIEHYFDNLDLQQEVNTKLDEMAEDGSLTNLIKAYVDPIQEAFETEMQRQYNGFESTVSNRMITQDENINVFKGQVGQQIANINTKVDAATSGSPLVASSTSEMTETDRVYVNTTDGKWYYYDGDSWEIGGTYQAAEDSSTVNTINKQIDYINIGNVYTQYLENKYLNDSFEWVNHANNVSCTTTQYATEDFILRVPTDFNLKIQFWSDGTQTGTPRITRQLNDQAIQKGSYYTFTIRKNSGSPITIAEASGIITDSRFNLINLDNIYKMLKNNKIPAGDYTKVISGNWWSSLEQWNSDNYTISIPFPVYFSNETKLKLNSGYQISCLYTATENMITDNDDITFNSNWLNEITIPSGTYATISVRKNPSAPININEIINLYIDDSIDFSPYETKIENKEYTEKMIDNLYTLNLNQYDFKESLFCNINHYSAGTQGFAIYGDYIVQLHSNENIIAIYQISTGEEIGTIDSSSLNIGHGDCIQFSDTKYDESDLFPIAYISKDTTPAVVQTIRISNLTTASKLKTYTFGSGTDIGYYCGHVCDFANNIMYQIGYKQNSYTSPTDNYMIVSSYDMTQETLISGDNYSLELLDKWTIPFIYVAQGQKFFDNKIFVISSYDSNVQENRIYIIDPTKKCIVRYYNKFETWGLYASELEDLDFILDSTNKKYDLIVSSKQGYYKLEQ